MLLLRAGGSRILPTGMAFHLSAAKFTLTRSSGSAKTPCIELNTGALGHGFPVAVGLALAAKKSQSRRRIFLITGDGELAEGSNWEAALAAAHYGLDNPSLLMTKIICN